MKFEVRRYGIAVIPETDEDRAYIEDTMGLHKDGDGAWLSRRNAMGLGAIAYLETTRTKDTHPKYPATSDPAEQIRVRLGEIYGGEQAALIARFICHTDPKTVLNTITNVIGVPFS